MFIIIIHTETYSLKRCFFKCELYLDNCHSCPTGSISLLKPFTKLIQICSRLFFQRQNFFDQNSEKRFVTYTTLVEENVEIVDDRNTRKKLSKMCNCSKNLWELKRTKREKYTQLPQQNWTSTLQSLFTLLGIKMKIRNPQVYDVSSPALNGIWSKMTTPQVLFYIPCLLLNIALFSYVRDIH